MSATKPPSGNHYTAGIDSGRMDGNDNHMSYEQHSRGSSFDHSQSVQKQQKKTPVVSQSEKKPNSNEMSHLEAYKQESENVYELKEEALHNPEGQLKQAIENLKSSDWNKAFEACNIIKRVAMYHKQLFQHPSSYTAQTFKDLVKPVDSLRSKLSKNACLTMEIMFNELTTRETDASIDTVMPILLKKATDTNQFISESAEKTLVTICHNCTETRVFSSLQQQSMKSNALKEKQCMLFTCLIEKLDSRLKNFRDVDKLVQSVAVYLDAGGAEIRNQAKYGILMIQKVTSSQRELDGVLLKARLNDR